MEGDQKAKGYHGMPRSQSKDCETITFTVSVEVDPAYLEKPGKQPLLDQIAVRLADAPQYLDGVKFVAVEQDQ